MQITEEQLTILKQAHAYLDMVELHGAANVGNLFQALARLEGVIQQIEENSKKESIQKKEEKPEKVKEG
jgi:uncharacterized protein YkvS